MIHPIDCRPGDEVVYFTNLKGERVRRDHLYGCCLTIKVLIKYQDLPWGYFVGDDGLLYRPHQIDSTIAYIRRKTTTLQEVI